MFIGRLFLIVGSDVFLGCVYLSFYVVFCLFFLGKILWKFNVCSCSYFKLFKGREKNIGCS